MNQKNRDHGYYWVKFKDSRSNRPTNWIVGQWAEEWYISGCDSGFDDSRMLEIDERRITREEPAE